MLQRKLKRKWVIPNPHWNRYLFVFLFIVAGLFLPLEAYAVDFTWDGGGDSTSWDDALNWTANSGYPDDNGDTAFLGSGSDSVSTPATALTIGTVLLGGSYTGTLTLGANLTLDDAGGEFGSISINAGTLDTSASNYALIVDNDLTILGTLIANASTITIAGDWDSSLGTFTVGTSTVAMTGTGKTFNSITLPARAYNLTIGDGASVTLGGGNWDSVNYSVRF